MLRMLMYELYMRIGQTPVILRITHSGQAHQVAPLVDFVKNYMNVTTLIVCYQNWLTIIQGGPGMVTVGWVTDVNKTSPDDEKICDLMRENYKLNNDLAWLHFNNRQAAQAAGNSWWDKLWMSKEEKEKQAKFEEAWEKVKPEMEEIEKRIEETDAEIKRLEGDVSSWGCF